MENNQDEILIQLPNEVYDEVQEKLKNEKPEPREIPVLKLEMEFNLSEDMKIIPTAKLLYSHQFGRAVEQYEKDRGPIVGHKIKKISKEIAKVINPITEGILEIQYDMAQAEADAEDKKESE